MSDISNWVKQHSEVIPVKGSVLDLACGSGRHSRYLAEKGYAVTAVDIDLAKIEAKNLENVTLVCADLETEVWPFAPVLFDCIVVTNYLWRPLFPALITSLKSGGYIIYETFAVGNEEYGRPRSPKFLLKAGELKVILADFEILAYEEGYRSDPSPSVRQSIMARKR